MLVIAGDWEQRTRSTKCACCCLLSLTLRIAAALFKITHTTLILKVNAPAQPARRLITRTVSARTGASKLLEHPILRFPHARCPGPTHALLAEDTYTNMIYRSSAALLLLVALLAGANGVSAFYDSSSSVVSLTAANFESKIKSGGVWLVEVCVCVGGACVWGGGACVVAPSARLLPVRSCLDHSPDETQTHASKQ